MDYFSVSMIFSRSILNAIKSHLVSFFSSSFWENKSPIFTHNRSDMNTDFMPIYTLLKPMTNRINPKVFYVRHFLQNFSLSASDVLCSLVLSCSLLSISLSNISFSLSALIGILKLKTREKL